MKTASAAAPTGMSPPRPPRWWEELGALTVTACVDYHPAEGAAAVCGLDEPALTLAMNYLSDTGADKALTLAVGLPTGDGGRYVTLDGETTIYRMEGGVLWRSC